MNYLINNFYSDYMIIWGYIGLNKCILKLISPVSVFRLSFPIWLPFFFFFFLAALGLGSTLLPAGFSLVAESSSYFLVAEHRLLIAMASLVTEYRL